MEKIKSPRDRGPCLLESTAVSMLLRCGGGSCYGIISLQKLSARSTQLKYLHVSQFATVPEKKSENNSYVENIFSTAQKTHRNE
jgi:hypothetical protein